MRPCGHILVVDDLLTNIHLLSAYLKSDGYEVEGAQSAEEALSFAASNKPDIILSDIMMPGMDGYELTRRLKANPQTKDIPIILITSLDDTSELIKGLDAGAEEFLSKPINQAELLARVHSLLHPRRPADQIQKITDKKLRQKTSAQDALKNILIIEDDELLSERMAVFLSQQGYQISQAGTIKDAKERLKKELPHIILLDILLPDASGLSLLKELKADKSIKHIPVMVITALQDIETKVKGIEMGADDYLIKPFQLEELAARIRTSLRRSALYMHLTSDMDDPYTDPVTKLHNWHYLEADVEKRLALVKRYKDRIFSLLMVEADTNGAARLPHSDSEQQKIMRAVAHLLEKTCRDCDLVTSYEDNLFCIILPETEIEGARILANRLHATLAKQTFSTAGGGDIALNIGIAQHDQSSNLAGIITAADKALEAARRCRH